LFVEKPSTLSQEEAMSPQGCGAGTENACFALARSGEGFDCSLMSNPEIAGIFGIKLGWRVNKDPSDNKAWCPKGVLEESKIATEL